MITIGTDNVFVMLITDLITFKHKISAVNFNLALILSPMALRVILITFK